jgi:hypothetical protein
LSVIIANLIYICIIFFAEIGEGDEPNDTTSVSHDLGSDLGKWQPFKTLKIWYAIIILLLTIVFRIYIFT